MAATKKTVKTTKRVAVADMKNADELRAALMTTQSELVEAKRSHAARELTNTESLREQRKHIARLHTALNILENTEEKA